MNIKKRRYDVILKLTILLALIGCFFIAKTEIVKAAIRPTVSRDSGTGIKVSLQSDDAGDFRGKYYIFLGENNTTGSGSYIGYINELTGDPASGEVSFSHDEILEYASQRGLKNADGLYLLYKSEGASDYTVASDIVRTNPIYTATTYPENGEIADGGIVNARTTLSRDSGSVKVYNNVAYCYAGAKVKYKMSIANDAYALKCWQNDSEHSEYHDMTLNYIIAPESGIISDVSYSPVLIKQVTDIALDGDTSTSFHVLAGTGHEFAVTKIPADADVNIGTTGVVTVTKISGGSGSYTYTPGTKKLKIQPDSNVSGDIVIKVSIKDGKGTNVPFEKTYTFTANTALSSVSVTASPNPGYVDVPITLTATPNTGSSVSQYTWSYKKDGGTETTITGTDSTCSFTPSATGSYMFKVVAKDALSASNTKEGTVTVTVGARANITGFTINPSPIELTTLSQEVKITVTPANALLTDDILYTAKSGFEIVEAKEVNGSTATFKLKYTGSEGTTTGKTIESAVTFASDNDNTKTKAVAAKVYIAPDNSKAATYTESSRTLKSDLPEKVIVGNDNSLSEVTGFKMYVYKGSTELACLDYKDKGRSYTTSASDLEKVITDNASKFSGDSDTIKIRVVPWGKYNGSDYKEAKTTDGSQYYWEKDVTVYKVSASGENLQTSQTYGLQGQKVWLTATPVAGYSFSKWDNGSTTNPREVTVSSSASGNQYKGSAVAGANTPAQGGGGYSGDGYDAVPKTSESNSPIFLILFAVFGLCGAGYGLFLIFKPAK